MQFIRYADSSGLIKYMPITAIHSIMFVDDFNGKHMIKIEPMIEVLDLKKGDINITLTYDQGNEYYQKVKLYFQDNS